MKALSIFRIYKIELTSIEDYLIGSQEDFKLKPTDKGWLSIAKSGDFYIKSFGKTHPNKLKRNIVAYCPYPNNQQENIVIL